MLNISTNHQANGKYVNQANGKYIYIHHHTLFSAHHLYQLHNNSQINGWALDCCSSRTELLELSQYQNCGTGTQWQLDTGYGDLVFNKVMVTI